MMDESDDLTLRVNLGGDGVSKLQHQVKDKLKELMGDYTDDTLVVCFAPFPRVLLQINSFSSFCV